MTLSHVPALLSAMIPSCLRNVQRKTLLGDTQNCNHGLRDLDFPDFILLGVTGKKDFCFPGFVSGSQVLATIL